MILDLEIKELDIKSDDRGHVIEVIKADNIKEVLFILSKPGATRGNHFHKSKAEWLCIIKGKAKLTYSDVATGKKTELIVNGDEKPTIIKTPKNIAHVVHNIGTDDLYMLEISDKIYDKKNPDTFKLLM